MLIMLAVGGLIAVLVPIWLVDRARSWIRTRHRRGSTVPLERVALADGRSLAEVMDEGRPVIITDLYDALEFTTAPDLTGLRSLDSAGT
jgi:hypothetical protein